jgi:hypothetical protein
LPWPVAETVSRSYSLSLTPDTFLPSPFPTPNPRRMMGLIRLADASGGLVAQMPEGDSMDGGGRAAKGSAAEWSAIPPPTQEAEPPAAFRPTQFRLSGPRAGRGLSFCLVPSAGGKGWRSVIGFAALCPPYNFDLSRKANRLGPGVGDGGDVLGDAGATWCRPALADRSGFWAAPSLDATPPPA